MTDNVSIEELKKHTFIVFGYEHYNPLGVVRSLGENGIKPVLFILKGDIRITSVSKYVGKVIKIDSYEEGYEILMRDYVNEKEKPFIIPCDEVVTEVFDQHYDEVKDLFYVSNAGEKGRLTYFMNKAGQTEIAERHGIRVPKNWTVKRGEFPEDLVYPLITKPLTSYIDWKLDYRICNNREELEEAFRTIKCDEIMLQQYISKVNELCLDGIAVNHGKEMFVSMGSTYTYILPDYFSFEMKIKNFDDEKILGVMQEIFAEVGYEGIFSFEFMIDEKGDLWFLEINFRNSGWSWASTKLGMNLPILWAKGMLTGRVADEDKKRIPEGFIALEEMSDFKHRVIKHRMISLGQWIKGVKKADCLYQWDKYDKKPVFVYWGGRIVRVVKKKLHLYKG